MNESARVTIVGRLVRDPETRYTPSGSMNVSFTVPVNRKWRDRAGNDLNRTTWFKVTAWRELAERLDALSQQGRIKKGTPVQVSGPIEQREYQTKDGETRFSLDVTAYEMSIDGEVIQVERQFAATGAQQMDFSDVPF